MQLVLDDVELHGRVRTEHGRAEGEARIVGASILPIAASFPLVLLAHQLLGGEGAAAQFGPLGGLSLGIVQVVGFVLRVDDDAALCSR